MIPASNWPITAGCPMRCIHSPNNRPDCNKQQDLSEKDDDSLLSMPRRCGEEKRMRVEGRHRKQRLSTNRKLILYFPTTTKARFSQNKPRCGS
jgi:hypothetical protein